MKYIFILSALFVFFPLISAELVIADKGMSEYQIVIPDQHRDKLFDKYIALGGNVIRTAVRKASGAELPVRRESVKIPGRSAIYVGNCRELKKYNIDPGRFQPWEHGISVRGRDIFVYGGDAPTPFKNRKPSYLHNTLGSLKAACFFAERFVNTRFVGMSLYSDGENHGVRTLPLKKITIPEKFEFRAKARFRHCDGNTGGLLYAVANNFFFDCGAEYDVHYHPRAVPQEKYFKSNPEYFALINGSRYYHGATALNKARPQYCLSNPAVQELIFREALSRADAGYKVVELGQSDGFKPCQCDNCRKWYGTSKWNEKLWLFHRDLADRLQKARPGVEIAIACYGPTHNIPASFDRFPGKGVIIDVAPATAELLESWKKFNLTGMAAWIYYFGNYLPCGYTPAYDLEFLQRENLRLHNTPVTSFYNCGLMASPALGGPWIYAWGQFCADPRKSIEVILRDYCRFGFGEKAAPYLIRFFKFIDRQMKRFPLESEDFNDFSSRRRINAIKLWNMRYPRSVIAELKKLFSAAMKYCDPADPMVRELKIEFEYMVLSAAVCHLAEELEKNPCDEKRLQLADAVDARRDFINKLPRLSWAPAHISGAFRNTKVVRLQAGGYDSGVFGGVFNSDTRLLRLRNRSLEAVRVKDFSDPRWKSIRSIKLLPMGRDTLELPVSFQLGYNEKAILIRCSAPLKKPPVKMPLERDSMKLWRNAVWETVIAAGDARRHFVFNPLPGSSYDAVVDTRDRRNTRWN
ncbi:MAG: DUF4838 domain-containing protein, partial [Lentisphaeria bacterium]|nr:DUF4838 domain-containing protein [Lentisphaeria bacterium]